MTGSGLFQGLANLTSVNLNGAKMPNVINMQSLFYNCTSLLNVDGGPSNPGYLTLRTS